MQTCNDFKYTENQNFNLQCSTLYWQSIFTQHSLFYLLILSFVCFFHNFLSLYYKTFFICLSLYVLHFVCFYVTWPFSIFLLPSLCLSVFLSLWLTAFIINIAFLWLVLYSFPFLPFFSVLI
jgi:hypothetical protein